MQCCHWECSEPPRGGTTLKGGYGLDLCTMVRGPERDVKRADVLESIDEYVVTTGDLESDLPCSRDTVYERLKELHELNEVKTKKVGARARVWWRPTGPTPDIDTDSLTDDEASIIMEITAAGNEPVNAPDVARMTGINKNTTYSRLDSLEEQGLLVSKKVGSNAKVWWIPTDGPL